MNDAALLFRTDEMAHSVMDLRDDIVTAGGSIEWSGMTPGMRTTLTESDLIRIASWTMLPAEMSYVVLLVYLPRRRRQQRATEAIADRLSHFIEQFGVENQPGHALLELSTMWANAAKGNTVSVPQSCVDIPLTGLPDGRMHLRSGRVVTAAEAEEDERQNFDALFGRRTNASDLPEDSGDMSTQARAVIRTTFDPQRVGRRQREGFQRRQEQEQEQAAAVPTPDAPQPPIVNWYDTEKWTIPAPDDSGGVWTYQISDMEDQHLWQTIIYLVRECTQLFTQYSPTRGNGSLALEAKSWLRAQPAFRALLQEAIRRELTFPQDVYSYLRQYALSKSSDAIQQTPPWKNPGAEYQTSQLEGFLREVLDPSELERLEAEHGKALRDIDLG